MRNLTCIREGREQQKIERAERERLQQEQKLAPRDAEDGYDYTGSDDEVDENEVTNEELAKVTRLLPPVDTHINSLKTGSHAAVLELLGNEAQVHPSIANRQRCVYKIGDSKFKEDLQACCQTFESMLLGVREQLYQVPNADNATSRSLFKSALTIQAEANLDGDQSDAFFCIARQVLKRELYRKKVTDTPPEQMLFYLGGEGGTGKSAVLNAITKYMTGLGIVHRLRKGAQTGVAAANIGGSTLHTLLGLLCAVKKKDLQRQRPASQKVIDAFENASLLFIDEISMTGCQGLQSVSVKLSDVLSNPVPFGGLDVVFAGDFYQLPPTTNDPLYRKPRLERNINLTKAAQGYLKFSGVTHAVFLKTQHRMSGDTEYRDMVTRYRHGDDSMAKQDETYLERHVIDMSSTLPDRLGHLQEDPIIIVRNNDLRYRINMLKARQHAKRQGQKLLICVAHDACKNTLSRAMRRDILLMPDGPKTGYAAGLLPMFVGMPVMIKRNLGPELGISNGCCGKLYDIVLDQREPTISYESSAPHYLKYHPLAVYVKIDTKTFEDGTEEIKFQVQGLPPNVMMLSTTYEKSKKRKPTVVYQPKSSPTTITLTRRQFEFLPSYAITVNASQGRTLHSAIIHLDGDYFINVKPYVMMSRLTSGKGLGILGKWKPSLWTAKPDPHMLDFLRTFLERKSLDTRNTLNNIRDVLFDLERQLTTR